MQEVGAAFRDHGLTTAIIALVGGTIALLRGASVAVEIPVRFITPPLSLA